MISLFKDIPEAIENTVIISKRCSFFLKAINPILPKYPGLENISESDYLSEISHKGLVKRFDLSKTKFSDDKINDYKNRLNKELKIIIEMGFAGYFLIVYDFIKWSKETKSQLAPAVDLPGRSIVAWSLNITDLDPINGLVV